MNENIVLAMNDSTKHFWLYVLRCQNNKWYIGITTKTPERRFIEHRDNVRAAAWTREHKPIELFDSRDLGMITERRAKLAENRAVREYMKKYGLNNVRGGDLSQTQKYSLFLNRIFPQDQWEWARISIYLLVLSGVLLCLYIYEHYLK